MPGAMLLYGTCTRSMPAMVLISSTSRLLGEPLPEIPTIAEAALPGYEAANWYAIVAPAATPRAIVARLNADLVRVLGVVDVRERMAAGGMEAQSMDSAAFGKHIHDEIAKWAKVVAASRAKPD